MDNLSTEIIENDSPKIANEFGFADKILVIDDEEAVRRTIRRMLSSCGWPKCIVAANVAEAKDLVETQNFDLILCDIRMPGESGLQFAKEIIKKKLDTAIVIVTGIEDIGTANEAISIGTYGYLTKPFSPNSLFVNVSNALKRKKLEKEAFNHKQMLENEIKKKTSDLQENVQRLNRTLNGVVNAIAKAVEVKDPYTAGHQKRVENIAVAIAEKIGWTRKRIDGLSIAASIHDIGKTAIPSAILAKPGKLSTPEFELIKSHAQIGYDILKPIEFHWPIADMVYQHHEKIDGSGYPQGLANNEIFEEAKIICVADVIEAMASHRPYRPALGIDAALEEIQRGKGSLFDCVVVDACYEIFREGNLIIET